MARLKFKYECPACGNVIITDINDELDCPICYSIMDFKGKEKVKKDEGS